MDCDPVSFFKLVGPAAADAARRFERFSDVRRSRDPLAYSYAEWHPSTRRAIAAWWQRLEEHRWGMPVAYYAQHIDLWSMGGQIKDQVLPGCGPQLMHDSGEIWLYPLPDRGRLVRRNKASSVRSAFADETRWFAARLIEAAKAYDNMWRESVLLIHRRRIGSSPTDDELKRDAAVVPAWLGRPQRKVEAEERD
jgi:hypothetical protein